LKLALLLSLLLATPLSGTATPPADKTVAVTLGGWRYFSGSPPAGWADPTFDDRGWGGPAPGPFVPDRPGLLPPPDNAPPVTHYKLERGQPVLLRARVTATDPAKVRVLELRVAYGDGFIAFLNGHEVARRGMAPSGTAALNPHGPEVEHVPIPVAGLHPGGDTIGLAIFASPVRSMVLPTVPAAIADVAAFSGVRITRGPYLNVHANGMAFRWQSDLPAAARITIARADGGASRVLHAAPTSDGNVVAGDLGHGKAYTYRLEVDAGHGDQATAGPFRFETMPPAPEPVRFAVYGDMRYPGHDAHRTIVAALAREAPPIVFNTGDLTDVGSEESNWQKYFEIAGPLDAIAPIVPAQGNHDGERRGTGGPITAALFGMSPQPPFWKSLDFGGVHFVLLSTNEMTNMAQRDWLREDLASARRHHARAIFAFCHEGPWSHGLHGSSDLMARVYAPILAAAHVDVLFSGHDHIYERGVGSTPAGKLTYIVTGGGGAPLYDPSCRAASGPPPGDVPHPLRPCPSSVAVLTKTYHYITVEVAKSGITLCPKHPDGTPVEPCIHIPHAD
jgi:acid phosphatase type 7